MLNCSICPNRPSFSDVSHLLTHVSSKGHLAQLHKLQVKSHQEIGAAVELAAYNQWYHDHGLAQLLSERLQQKETKLATRKETNRKRNALKDREEPVDPALQPGSTGGGGRHTRTRSKRAKKEKPKVEDSAE
jgi:hypothetical protein